MHNPIATYRLQFHEGFTFSDFERIIPYLHRLGVTTVYASPVFSATPGSTHGYDGTHPHRISPAIGTPEQLQAISRRLQELGMGWLQDIVPNHMAFHTDNLWLMDVLEKGRHSCYAPFFDIDWNSPVYNGRLMVPFLGKPLEEVVEQGELKLAFKENRLVLCYYDTCYPLHPHSYGVVLHAGVTEGNEALRELMGRLPAILLTISDREFNKRWESFRNDLSNLMRDEAARAFLYIALKEINNDSERVRQLAEEQHYRLCHWQETDRQINYRRFFTVNGLICLNIQDPEVFQHYHRLIKTQVDDGVFQGLRIDHIDGLYDPAGYLEQLRELVGPDAYIVVEKILETGEDLPTDWPVQGNTGYDFLSLVNNLFSDETSEQTFTKFYRQLVGKTPAIERQIHQKKAYILYEHMAGELDNLYHLFLQLELLPAHDLSLVSGNVLRDAIGQMLIRCPVYRFYGNQFPLDATEAGAVRDILKQVRKEEPQLKPGVDLLEQALLEHPAAGTDDYNERILRFYQRCMQFSGPLMAKGVEDTLMYTHTSFIAHNDVGDSPEFTDMTREHFHRAMLARQARWPLSINTTSTHDTKRGEGVRARLAVLTDLAGEWIAVVKEWQVMNAGLKVNGMPDANDEYFIYQTLVGTYPLKEEPDYADRIREYLRKALREAKTHSNWTSPNETYEEAACSFAVALLDKGRPFWDSFRALHSQVADFGMVNSLSQVLLKFTCPGVPDVYQGTELWDLSLVDPDNRRPVDYGLREEWLAAMDNVHQQETLLRELWEHRTDARIKLWLIQRLYRLVKQEPDLFTKGHYIPLRTTGKYKDHVLAFARRQEHTWYLTAIPLNTAQIARQQGKDHIGDIDWKDTGIRLREEAPKEWEHLLVPAKGKEEESGIAVAGLFTDLPFALLKLAEPVTDRGAGILLAISSLPSRFGIGDFGPEARAFARFLSRGKQKYWQLLPLTPTEGGSGHSPYSSISSRAGNTLLISPELLAEAGLLEAADLKPLEQAVKDKADYEKAGSIKEALFEKAWQRFPKGASRILHYEFQQFCGEQAYWLDDFALFVALKQQHDGYAWYDWPAAFKDREEAALQTFAADHHDELQKIKWLQFIFLRQWKDLRAYCNSLGVRMFGDMPFYISHDSAEVWAHRDIFNLDEEGRMQGVAGVPPDYFSEDGQLWGMPTFRWEVLQEQRYRWWVERIRKNLELFDLLRLDHFRAFQDYWEVPAGEETAKNGKWLPGPRADIFRVFREELGSLPFVAEDLGDQMDDVYVLRDELGLPGMKVLQFAFGDHMMTSVDAPHNYTSPNCIVYTGTHDNNTTAGWYRQEAAKEGRRYLEHYLNRDVPEKEVHRTMAALAYATIAKIAILPLQDVLGLDEDYRMNTPGASQDNWRWRVKPEQLNAEVEAQLRDWVRTYQRI